jgi:sulfopyruvate decarboxylase TPP-binding subunit
MIGDKISVKPCDINIKKILQLTDKMIELAEIGDAQREDTGCGILYGVLLDSAYKLKRLAEKEKENHINKGWWKNDIE